MLFGGCLFILLTVFFILHYIFTCSLLNPPFYIDVVVACLLPYRSFILMVLLYFCLFVDHENKTMLFVFGAIIYHFKNTISIFVTILLYKAITTYVAKNWFEVKDIIHWHALSRDLEEYCEKINQSFVFQKLRLWLDRPEVVYQF